MALTKVTHSMIAGAPAYLIDFNGGVGKTAAENNAAIAAAFAANNTVVLPSGTITYSTTIAMNGNKTLIGEGQSNTILEYTGNSHGIAVTNSNNTVSRLRVKASSSAASGIYLNAALGNFFEGVYVVNNPPKGWWLYGDDLNRSVYWNIFRDCGCDNAVLPVVLEGTGTGAVNGNTWYDGIWRTSAVSGGTVCYLNGDGNGTGGNVWVGGDWSGYGGNTFVVDSLAGPGGASQNSWFGVFIDTGADTGFVLGSNSSTNTIMGGTIQATTAVVQNNIASGTAGTDIIMISSKRYLPFITPEPLSTPTLLNSWVNYGGNDAPAKYWKDSVGMVHIEGSLKSGTTTDATNLFVLPTGYRPVGTVRFTVPCINGATATQTGIAIASDGVVYLAGAAPGNTLLSVSCSFRAT